MLLRFLGTGAADWNGPDENGEYRRFTSTLLDGRVLIDVTKTVLDMIPDKSKVTDVFFTHSHRDHFDPEALKALAPCRVHAHESWAGEISGDGLTVIPLKTGVSAEAAEYTFLPMPSNHSTPREYETTLHYLIEGGGRCLLYATDGAWLLNSEHRMIGNKVLSAAVFDATIGDAIPGDWRIFEHNSVDMVRLMVKTLLKAGRLGEGAPVFLTHFARTLHPSQAELERSMEPPLRVCFDGMEARV